MARKQQQQRMIAAQRAAYQRAAIQQRLAMQQQVQRRALAQASYAQQQARAYAGAAAGAAAAQGASSYDNIVTLQDIWVELEYSSEVWQHIPDTEPKLATVRKYIDFFSQKNATIRKDPLHYVQLIDAMATANPSMLKNPFEDVMRTVAIMEYDYDIGVNPDQLARQVLGESGYQQNKQRLGL